MDDVKQGHVLLDEGPLSDHRIQLLNRHFDHVDSVRFRLLEDNALRLDLQARH